MWRHHLYAMRAPGTCEIDRYALLIQQRDVSHGIVQLRLDVFHRRGYRQCGELALHHIHQRLVQCSSCDQRATDITIRKHSDEHVLLIHNEADALGVPIDHGERITDRERVPDQQFRNGKTLAHEELVALNSNDPMRRSSAGEHFFVSSTWTACIARSMKGKNQ